MNQERGSGEKLAIWTGETFLICRNGKPVADLVPHKNKSRLTPHPSLSKFKIKYDPTEPLTAEEWPEEER